MQRLTERQVTHAGGRKDGSLYLSASEAKTVSGGGDLCHPHARQKKLCPRRNSRFSPTVRYNNNQAESTRPGPRAEGGSST
jgi:hypothetical protein